MWWAADLVSCILIWELESLKQLYLLLRCAVVNTISHKSTVALMSLGSPAGSGDVVKPLHLTGLLITIHRLMHSASPTDVGGKKKSHLLFQQNKVRPSTPQGAVIYLEKKWWTCFEKVDSFICNYRGKKLMLQVKTKCEICLLKMKEKTEKKGIFLYH